MRVLMMVYAGLVLFSVTTVSAAPSAETCRVAATAFMSALTDEQKSEAVRPFEHAGRKKWTNLPGSRFRDEGLTFEDMTDAQRKLGHRLVQCGLSSQGYQKAIGIMRVDDYLLSKIEDPSQLPEGFDFGSGYYWLGILAIRMTTHRGAGSWMAIILASTLPWPMVNWRSLPLSSVFSPTRCQTDPMPDGAFLEKRKTKPLSW